MGDVTTSGKASSGGATQAPPAPEKAEANPTETTDSEEKKIKRARKKHAFIICTQVIVDAPKADSGTETYFRQKFFKVFESTQEAENFIKSRIKSVNDDAVFVIISIRKTFKVEIERKVTLTEIDD